MSLVDFDNSTFVDWDSVLYGTCVSETCKAILVTRDIPLMAPYCRLTLNSLIADTLWLEAVSKVVRD